MEGESRIVTNLPLTMNEAASAPRLRLSSAHRRENAATQRRRSMDLDALRERTAARIAAHRLVQAVQDEPRPGLAAINDLIELGDRNLWHEVSVVARCAAALLSDTDTAVLRGLLDEMARRAETSRDPGLVALALSFRASIQLVDTTRQGALTTEAETDLVTAVVLLESKRGGSLERVSAHIACGATFGAMRLWELELAQYEEAARIKPTVEEPSLAGYERDIEAFHRPILYNRVESETTYACGLEVVGDNEGVRAHSALALRHFVEVQSAPGWPATWVAELEACALLARVLAGDSVPPRELALATAAAEQAASSRQVRDSRSGAAVAMRIGNIQLAVALWLAAGEAGHAGGTGGTPGPGGARAMAEAAIATLKRSGSSQMLSLTLAMDLAARLEAAPAGYRLAQAQTEKLWAGRERDAAAIEALINTERLRLRSEELERHAHIDELTGLANRRGFYRHVDELVAKNCAVVSLLVIDVDRFKEVNDRHGHQEGDQALRRLAGVLRRLVRARDLAARFGGDEFLLILEGTDHLVAVERARIIQDTVAASSAEGHDVPMTVSIGVASGSPVEFGLLLADADRAMYQGKATTSRRWGLSARS
jgi:diguanylate cyclase (GGDEF)-like protein